MSDDYEAGENRAAFFRETYHWFDSFAELNGEARAVQIVDSLLENGRTAGERELTEDAPEYESTIDQILRESEPLTAEEEAALRHDLEIIEAGFEDELTEEQARDVAHDLAIIEEHFAAALEEEPDDTAPRGPDIEP